VAAALAALRQRFAVEHVMGSVGKDYSDLLLGAIDIEGKRYARLQWSSTRVVCVPWIDAFAERIGEKFRFATTTSRRVESTASIMRTATLTLTKTVT